MRTVTASHARGRKRVEMNRRDFLGKAAVGGVIAGATIMTKSGLAAASGPAPQSAAPSMIPHITNDPVPVQGNAVGDLTYGFYDKDQYGRLWTSPDLTGHWLLLNLSSV